jgi:hypothetical protein
LASVKDLLTMSTESPPRVPPPTADLRDALRRARADSAERSGVLVELRTVELGRLDLLKEALEPLFAQVPAGVDLFHGAILPGEPARLFVDVLGFVEMGRDKRTYCFFQDTRYGRRLMAESDRLPVIVEAVTDYVARRLVEREKALASDLTPARLGDEPEGKPPVQPVAAPAPTVVPPTGRRGSLVLLFLVALVVTFVVFLAVGQLWRLGLR